MDFVLHEVLGDAAKRLEAMPSAPPARVPPPPAAEPAADATLKRLVPLQVDGP